MRHTHRRFQQLLAATTSSFIFLGACAPSLPSASPAAAPTTGASTTGPTAAPAQVAAPTPALVPGAPGVVLGPFGEPHQCETGKEEWRVAGPPKRGGTLVRPLLAAEHLDPTKSGRVAAIGRVYEGLLEYRSCFYGDYTPAPRLAESWTTSADARTWTFKLRQDARWQNVPPVNGRPLTSADVGWTVDYQKNGGLLKSFWQNVTYSTPDPHTIVFELSKPDADFLAKLADYRNLILPHEVQEQYGDFKTVAIGSGAFMLKEFRPTQELALVRNPDYREKGLDGQSLPYLDGIRAIEFPDYSAMLAALRSGQLDTTTSVGVRPLDVEPLLKSNPRFQHFPDPISSYHSVFFNLARTTPFNDVRVRKAVSLAISREDVMTSAGGGVYGGFIPAYLADWAWPQEKLKAKARPDQAQARQLLQEAGFSAGQLKPVLKTTAQYREQAEVVLQQLSAVGIAATLQEEPGGSFGAVLQRADFDIAYGAYAGSHFPNFWLGDYIESGSNQNFVGIRDPKIDGLIAQHSRELDHATRSRILDELQEHMWDTMYIVPIISDIYHHVLSCRLTNVRKMNEAFNGPMVIEVWMDQTRC
jgi:peptide/nickel transport system substrate-binding protein